MSFTLSFDGFVEYDAAHPGITLEIELKLAGKNVTVSAKIDTGATDCIFFARHIGEYLEINIEDGEPTRFNTATGSFSAYRHDVTIAFLDYEFDANICFAADESFSRNVVGRHGFLDRMILGLVDYEGKLNLGKYGAS